MAAGRDHYTVLGVSHSASGADIHRAYRTLARRYHPDINPSEDARTRFEEVSSAYDVLNDPQRRDRYDRSTAGARSVRSEVPVFVHRRPSRDVPRFLEDTPHAGAPARSAPVGDALGALAAVMARPCGLGASVWYRSAGQGRDGRGSSRWVALAWRGLRHPGPAVGYGGLPAGWDGVARAPAARRRLRLPRAAARGLRAVGRAACPGTSPARPRRAGSAAGASPSTFVRSCGRRSACRRRRRSPGCRPAYRPS